MLPIVLPASFGFQLPTIPKNPRLQSLETWERDPSPQQGLGSGFLTIDDKGYILTNAHVVSGAKTIEVILKDQKDPMQATLVGKDRGFDAGNYQN